MRDVHAEIGGVRGCETYRDETWKQGAVSEYIAHVCDKWGPGTVKVGARDDTNTKQGVLIVAQQALIDVVGERAVRDGIQCLRNIYSDGAVGDVMESLQNVNRDDVLAWETGGTGVDIIQ